MPLIWVYPAGGRTDATYLGVSAPGGGRMPLIWVYPCFCSNRRFFFLCCVRHNWAGGLHPSVPPVFLRRLWCLTPGPMSVCDRFSLCWWGLACAATRVKLCTHPGSGYLRGRYCVRTGPVYSTYSMLLESGPSATTHVVLHPVAPLTPTAPDPVSYALQS
jgi:hypothetical protein